MIGRYITIEREYGSGGTEIAQRLSQETGVPCYGREILEEVSRRYHLSIDAIEQYEETITNSFLYSIYVMSKANSADADMLATEGHIYVAEQSAIQRFAAQGPGIFVGHCASEALRGWDGVVKVFIGSSDNDKKNKRITHEYGIPELETESKRKWFDRKRARYYNANTGKKWENLSQYDLVLDSGTLGIPGCVAVLKGLLERD